MSVEGKTVARIEESADGYGAVMLIVFTDGTALEITGHSYEDCDLTQQEIGPDKVAEYAQQAAERAEKEREAQEKREAWLALPQEERDRLEAERRAKMSPLARAVEDEMKASLESMRSSMNRMAFGHRTTIDLAPLFGQQKGRARRS